MKNNRLLPLFLLLFAIACRPSRDRLAKQCADLFPVKTDTVTFVRDSVHYDTLFFASPPRVLVKRDTLFCPPSDSAKMLVKEIVVDCTPCPALRIEKRVQVIEKYIHLENTAATERAEFERDSMQLQQHKAQQQASDATKWVRNWRIIALSGWSMVGIFILLTAWIWTKRHDSN